MPTNLESQINNRRLRFGDNGRVQELDPAGAVLRETNWGSLSGEGGNRLAFTFAGEAQQSVALKCAFNERNQLTLQIVAQPGVPAASATWTLQGKIVVDSVTAIAYALVDDNGDVTSRKLTFAAKLDFPKGNAQLRAQFPDGSETYIKGLKESRSLTAGNYAAGGDLARDLLAFTAVTGNTIDGQVENMAAEVKFYGRWDLHQNSLVFVTHYDTTGAKPVGYVAIAGEVKGTNVGLIIEQNGSAALQIRGTYAWNKNTLGWDLNVGYSKAAGIEARVSANAAIAGKNGTLTFKGSASLKKGTQAKDLTFDLAVDYTTKGGKLSFQLSGEAGSYAVKLSGDFAISNGFVKFAITAADKDGKKVVTGSVEFGYYTQDSDLKLSIEAVLGPNGIQLKLDLQFRFYWGPTGPVAELP